MITHLFNLRAAGAVEPAGYRCEYGLRCADPKSNTNGLMLAAQADIDRDGGSSGGGGGRSCGKRASTPLSADRCAGRRLVRTLRREYGLTGWASMLADDDVSDGSAAAVGMGGSGALRRGVIWSVRESVL